MLCGTFRVDDVVELPLEVRAVGAGTGRCRPAALSRLLDDHAVLEERTSARPVVARDGAVRRSPEVIALVSSTITLPGARRSFVRRAPGPPPRVHSPARVRQTFYVARRRKFLSTAPSTHVRRTRAIDSDGPSQRQSIIRYRTKPVWRRWRDTCHTSIRYPYIASFTVTAYPSIVRAPVSSWPSSAAR